MSGASAAEGAVGITATLALDALFRENPPAALEACDVAADPARVPAAAHWHALREAGLIDDDGRMHDLTRAAVLAWSGQ